MEEFQAAEQQSESERAGHLVSLEEQLQAVRLKVCILLQAPRWAPSCIKVNRHLRCLCCDLRECWHMYRGPLISS